MHKVCPPWTAMSRAQDLNRRILLKHIHIFTVVVRAYL